MMSTLFPFQKTKTTFLLLVLALMVATTTLSAQTFNGGVKTAVVVSQIAGDGLSGFNKVGINAGFFAQYQWLPSWSVQMDLAFIQKGSSQKLNPDEPDAYSYLLRLNYVELPLVLQYHTKPLVFEAGLSFDFLAGYAEKINSQINDQGEVWQKINVNTVIGVQYYLNDRWVASIRSVNSVSSIRKNSVPLNVRRYGKKFGAYNDVISVGLLFRM